MQREAYVIALPAAFDDPSAVCTFKRLAAGTAPTRCRRATTARWPRCWWSRCARGAWSRSAAGAARSQRVRRIAPPCTSGHSGHCRSPEVVQDIMSHAYEQPAILTRSPPTSQMTSSHSSTTCSNSAPPSCRRRLSQPPCRCSPPPRPALTQPRLLHSRARSSLRTC